MTRLLAAARLHTVMWPAAYGWPLLIMAIPFAINLVLFATVLGRLDPPPPTGALVSIYVGVAIIAAASVPHLLRYALGMSVTRTRFYAATALVAALQSLVYAVLLTVLGLVERATGGWGVNLQFFAPDFLWVGNPLVQVVVYAVPFLLCSAKGIAAGVVVTRWGGNGMLTLVTSALLVLGAVVVLITWLKGWPAVWEWFGAQPTLALFAGWPLLFVAAAAGAGLWWIRRVTP
jgi:hypothetical protein